MSMLSEAPEGHPVAKDKKTKKTHVYSERICEHSDLYLHKLTYTYIYTYIYRMDGWMDGGMDRYVSMQV